MSAFDDLCAGLNRRGDDVHSHGACFVDLTQHCDRPTLFIATDRKPTPTANLPYLQTLRLIIPPRPIQTCGTAHVLRAAFGIAGALPRPHTSVDRAARLRRAPMTAHGAPDGRGGNELAKHFDDWVGQAHVDAAAGASGGGRDTLPLIPPRELSYSPASSCIAFEPLFLEGNCIL